MNRGLNRNGISGLFILGTFKYLNHTKLLLNELYLAKEINPAIYIATKIPIKYNSHNKLLYKMKYSQKQPSHSKPQLFHDGNLFSLREQVNNFYLTIVLIFNQKIIANQ